MLDIAGKTARPIRPNIIEGTHVFCVPMCNPGVTWAKTNWKHLNNNINLGTPANCVLALMIS